MQVRPSRRSRRARSARRQRLALWSLALLLGAGSAAVFADYPGKIPNGTVLGNISGTTRSPYAISDATTVNGVPCALGSTCAVSATAAGVTIGSTTVTGGTSGDVLVEVSGILQSATRLTAAHLPTDVSYFDVAETRTALMTVNNSDLALLGSSTGKTTFTSLNAGASNFTVNLPGSTTNVPIIPQVITVTGPSAARTWTVPDASVTLASLTTADQTLSGGANVTSLSIGTVTSGTTTIDCGTSPLQYLTNGGAFTLAAPVADGSCIVQTINNGSAGTITFSGFTVGTSTGDALDITNGHKFAISIWRINGTSGYRVANYQ
jgi:hypothetical protein